MNRFFRIIFIGVALSLWASVVHAETVTALSSDVTQVGQPVVLVYRFINTGMPEDMPRPSIAVAGLDIRYNGMQTQNRMSWNFGGGGNRSTSETAFEFQYIVVPNQPGDFTIPGFDVRAEGKLIRTKPVTLRVAGGGNYAPQMPNPQQIVPSAKAPQPLQPPPRNRQSPSPNDMPFYGEIVMGSKTAFVGEVIPIELRFYFRADASFDNLQRPSFGGEGFTFVPLSEPEQTTQDINGQPYNVVTFRSAITPVKSGEIEIPPAVMEGRMVVQGGPSGLDPFFEQFFGNFPGMGRAENIQARTNLRKLEVLSLPKEGRPTNFSGAVGQFTMEAKATPKTAASGEPIALQLSVSGRGNFDALVAPELTDDKGWRTYAPKSSFVEEDSRGFGKSSGTKTFEFSMIARQDQTATPGASFSYFDPRDKKYVTLTTAPVAVKAQGATAGAAASAEASATPSTPTAAAAAPATDDIAPPSENLSKYTPYFEPSVKSAWFFGMNVILLIAALISIPWLVWMRKRTRKSALTSELEMMRNQAKTEWQNAREKEAFYQAAAHYVLAQLALWENKPITQVNPSEALLRFVPDLAIQRELEAVLGRRDEIKYGGSDAQAFLDPQERSRIVEALEKLSASHA